MKRAEREERKQFIRKLIEDGMTPSEAIKKYDERFGTHYRKRIFPLSAK